MYAVTVADHGRARVLVAGDVVQINGKRPPYVAEARRDAKRAGKALSAAVGLTVPVTPVLTFVGSGVISVHGLPKDCLVATHRELDRLLDRRGRRISPATASKLSAVAQHPATWAQRRRTVRPPTTGGTTSAQTAADKPADAPVTSPATPRSTISPSTGAVAGRGQGTRQPAAGSRADGDHETG